ncbi:UNVERIFIED_ORG: hypothetical protein J2W85_002099 [Ensifer adhaerens]|nr:hypothetical protein [Ensifer adhaerens]
MNPKLLHILQHSLGADEYGRGGGYRDHFVTGEGSNDHADCMELVEAGFMTRRATIEMYGGDDFFRVTEEGKLAMLQYSPQPPKLTKGQQRYQDYLDADCSMTFIEYLKYRDARDRSAA